jgi:hypothetical protein
MKKHLLTQNLLLGFLSWLFPFAISFLFYKPGGELIVPYATFKSTIMVIGLVFGCYLLYRYFKCISSNYISNGIIVGFSWFAINIILDSLLLIPLMKTTFADYFLSIGLSYIALPVISITMGYLVDYKTELGKN